MRERAKVSAYKNTLSLRAPGLASIEILHIMDIDHTVKIALYYIFITYMNIYFLDLYARYLCSRDALGLKAGRPSAARDDRVSCIQFLDMHDI